MERLLAGIIRHPVVSLCFLALLVLPSAWNIRNLEIDDSTDGLLPEGDPAFTYYQNVKEQFGSDALTVVVIEGRDGDVFTEETLTLVETLTEEIAALDGVTRVRSLTTINLIRGEDAYLETGRLLEYIPADEVELDEIRKKALGHELLKRSLISDDGKTTAVNVYTENADDDKTFNRRISGEIDRLIEKHKKGHHVFQIGNPYLKTAYSTYLKKDQQTLVPLSIFVVLLLLLVSFRSVTAMILPILASGLSILVTLGFMALAGYPINVITVLVPSLLIAIGCSEAVHMICRYYRGLRAGQPQSTAIAKMVDHCALPIASTALTTFIGFAALSINEITLLKQFGIVAAFGIIVNFVITIIVVPLGLRYAGIPHPFTGDKKPAGRYSVNTVLNNLVRFNPEHRKPVLLVTLCIAVLALIGCFRLVVNTDFISYFKGGSPIVERVDRIHQELSGALSFFVVVETGDEGGITQPEVLDAIAKLQKHMDDMEVFDKSFSIADYVKAMNKEMNGGKEEMQTIPDSQALIEQYLLLLGDDDLRGYTDTDFTSANIVVTHNIRSSRKLSQHLGDLDAFIARNFSDDHTVRLTGELLLLNQSADAMVEGQVKSLGVALIAIFFIMWLLFRSLTAGLLAMVSNILPILLNFGLMGWLGIPLNTGTCMVGAIALGIAVNDTIHFMVNFRRELRSTGDRKLAAAEAIRTEGEPIFITSAGLALGFSVLMVSNFSITVHFGFLSALVMVYALLSDLFANPCLLLSVDIDR